MNISDKYGHPDCNGDPDCNEMQSSEQDKIKKSLSIQWKCVFSMKKLWQSSCSFDRT